MFETYLSVFLLLAFTISLEEARQFERSVSRNLLENRWRVIDWCVMHMSGRLRR